MTDSDQKQFYFNLIEQIGHDANAVCHWEGPDFISLDEWKKAWWQAFTDHCEYERRIGARNERERIAKELLNINKHNL